MSRTGFAALAALAALVLAAAGYWLRGVSQKHVEERQVTEALRDTTEQLRQALAPRAPVSLVARIDENLEAAKAPRSPQLAAAAGLYIVGAREIARRRVEIERLERQAAADRATLEAHMTRGGRRNEAWFSAAMDLKKRVERDHADLDRTLQALGELLATLPQAEQDLAPYVQPAVLLDEASREQARRQAGLQAKRASAALEHVRALAYR